MPLSWWKFDLSVHREIWYWIFPGVDSAARNQVQVIYLWDTRDIGMPANKGYTIKPFTAGSNWSLISWRTQEAAKHTSKNYSSSWEPMWEILGRWNETWIFQNFFSAWIKLSSIPIKQPSGIYVQIPATEKPPEHTGRCRPCGQSTDNTCDPQ